MSYAAVYTGPRLFVSFRARGRVGNCIRIRCVNVCPPLSCNCLTLRYLMCTSIVLLTIRSRLPGTEVPRTLPTSWRVRLLNRNHGSTYLAAVNSQSLSSYQAAASVQVVFPPSSVQSNFTCQLWMTSRRWCRSAVWHLRLHRSIFGLFSGFTYSDLSPCDGCSLGPCKDVLITAVWCLHHGRIDAFRLTTLKVSRIVMILDGYRLPSLARMASSSWHLWSELRLWPILGWRN